MNLRRVCVYAASSAHVSVSFQEAAAELGRTLARADLEVVYGGGAIGLMGALANAALQEGGKVTGIIPGFMIEREWGHQGTDLQIVPDMHTRKQRMIEGSDAIVALPGGCGTLEELLEAITWKRLGLHRNPIVILNVKGFYTPLAEQLDRCVSERMMSDVHGTMWRSVDTVAEVLPSLRAQGLWDSNALDYAAVEEPNA